MLLLAGDKTNTENKFRATSTINSRLLIHNSEFAFPYLTIFSEAL